MRSSDPKEAAGGNRPGRAGRRSFRFPCGHVEGSASVDRRLRVTERAVWVRCRACNTVALAVASKEARAAHKVPT